MTRRTTMTAVPAVRTMPGLRRVCMKIAYSGREGWGNAGL
jgi:hypothetical protein